MERPVYLDPDARLGHWLDARVMAMFLVRSWGYQVMTGDWPPVWRVHIPLSHAEVAGLRLLASLDLGRVAPERQDDPS